MKPLILKLIFMLSISCALCGYSQKEFLDRDFCKFKLGCINWKRSYVRCNKWCVPSFLRRIQFDDSIMNENNY